MTVKPGRDGWLPRRRAFSVRSGNLAIRGKQRAFDQIAARRRAADEKRREDAERLQQTAVALQSALVQ